PGLDDLAASDGEDERLAAIDGRVELLTALEPARVVHGDGFARLRRGAGALDEVHVPEPARGLDDLFAHALISSPVSPRALGGYGGNRRAAGAPHLNRASAVACSSRRRFPRRWRT